MVINDVLILEVRPPERSAKDAGGDAKHSAASPEEQLYRGVGEELLSGAGGLDGVLDKGLEGVALEGKQVHLGADARVEGGVELQLEPTSENRPSALS